ncbi:MAG: serine hydrolase [Christensenellaceae bacterium]
MEQLDRLIETLKAFGGKTGLYARNLITGQTLRYRAGEPFLAASVIKIPILAACFDQMEQGVLRPDEPFTIHHEDKMPSCGALSYMHDGLQVTAEDLYTLMIILSDNTATNLLIDRLGARAVNDFLDRQGMSGTRLNRRLFAPELARQGIENTIVPEEIGRLLQDMEAGALVSPGASRAMLDILKKQRLNGKIPVLLPPGTAVAHKTGEDAGITHDVGIVYGPQPFVLCLCANGVETGPFERAMQQIARELYDAWQ